jgi:serine/threonine-protein kinase
MAIDRWDEVQRVLEQVLDMPATAREAHLTNLGQTDPELSREVARLLRACAEAEGDTEFLASPAVEFLAPALTDVEAQTGDQSAESVRARLAGALAGRYSIERELGHGGMALVFLARDERHGRAVALKVMRPGLLGSSGADRFLSEIRIVAGLSHPHVLPLHDSGEAAGLLYYVTPFLTGESLRNRMTREGALPLPDALRILRDVTSALAYAHRQGIVHRDIKPENILLQDGHAVVADFGIARAVGRALDTRESGIPESAPTVQVSRPLGTPAYMAPEAVSGGPGDHRVDLYALGVVAYEVLAGEHPFGRDPPEGMLSAHLTRKPEPLASRRPAIPQALSDLVTRLLAKRPEDRCANGQEVLAELESLRAGRSGWRGFPRWSIGVAAGTVALTVLLLIRGGASQDRYSGPLDPRKVAVAAFAGSEGSSDPALDRIGQIAADWITLGLVQTKLVTVTPVGPLLVQPSGGKASGTVDAAILTAARTMGAGWLIAGTYAGSGDEVLLQVRVIDVEDASVVRSVGPIRAPRDTTLAWAEELRQRVVAALTTVVDPRLAAWSGIASQPVRFEAYQAFSEGLTAFFDQNRGRNPVPLFRLAHSLDTSFTAPLLWALFRVEALPLGDTLRTYLEERRGVLPVWDRGLLDFFSRTAPEDGTRAFRSVVEAAPQSEWLYMLAWAAMAENKPALAVRSLERLDPDRGWMREWPAYFGVLAEAHHYLGQYDAELVAARRGRERFPMTLSLLLAEVRALAALNRTDELALALASVSYASAMVRGGLPVFEEFIRELRVHGHRAQSESLADRLLAELAVFEEQSAQKNAVRARFEILWAAERVQEAEPLLEQLLARGSPDRRLLEMRVQVAAARGRRAEAERMALALRRDWVPVHPMGAAMVESRHFEQLAGIHIWFGEYEKALQLLLAAMADVRSARRLHTQLPFDRASASPPLLEFTQRRFDDSDGGSSPQR